MIGLAGPPQILIELRRGTNADAEYSDKAANTHSLFLEMENLRPRYHRS